MILKRKEAILQITAILGATNTGKTHYALALMLSYRSGIIGLPLRLLAREIYDKIVQMRGVTSVALITGEERIIPLAPAYWVATTEAMPRDIPVECVVIDEIQSASDPERGHIFTDRILNMRGQEETLLVGSRTMHRVLKELLPHAKIITRTRLSKLSYKGHCKLNHIKPRSAIVSFSINELYRLGEILRQQKGGAAIVMGGLSPRARNRQVEIYQNCDVDYLVATDAIGMGLNLDIAHIAFSSLRKFDGKIIRPLFPHEIGQIAGRAGRYKQPGSFGILPEAGNLDSKTTQNIENSQFRPLTKLKWRNNMLDFSSGQNLLASLRLPPQNPWLALGRVSDDEKVLDWLIENPKIRPLLQNESHVRLLWESCSIPDFREISFQDHCNLIEKIFAFRIENGTIPENWFAQKIQKLNDIKGTVDTLAHRLAFIRSWVYITQKSHWVENASYWQKMTHMLEEKLSDALHDALCRRFVDKRISLLIRGLKHKKRLSVYIEKNNEIKVENHYIGRLDGFCFIADSKASAHEIKTLRATALVALDTHYNARAYALHNAPDSALSLEYDGKIYWQDAEIARLKKGADILCPDFILRIDDHAPLAIHHIIIKRLHNFIKNKISTDFAPLFAIYKDDNLKGVVRGIGFRLYEGLGVIERASIKAEIAALPQEERAKLRQHHVRFGQFYIFIPALLKPAPTALRLILSMLWFEHSDHCLPPTPGLTTMPITSNDILHAIRFAGFHIAGKRAIRIDIIERLFDLIHAIDTKKGFEATAEMLNLCGLSHSEFAHLLASLNYEVTQTARVKNKQKAFVEDISSQEPPDRQEEKIFIFHWQGTKARSHKTKKPKITTKRRPEKPKSAKKENNKISSLSNPFIVALKGFTPK